MKHNLKVKLKKQFSQYLKLKVTPELREKFGIEK